MKKKLSSISFGIFLLFAITAAAAFTATAQNSSVAGTWKNGSVGAISYKNMVTGATKPGRGSVFWYKFLPNGTYEFVGYMEVSMYNCTTTLFNQIAGRYSVSGSTISLDPAKDYWKNTNSCAPSSNKERLQAPKKLKLQFRSNVDEYGNQQICLDEGKGETCYRRETE